MHQRPIKQRSPRAVTTTIAAVLHFFSSVVSAGFFVLISFVAIAWSRGADPQSAEAVSHARTSPMGVLVWLGVIVVLGWLVPSTWVGVCLLARRQWARWTLVAWYCAMAMITPLFASFAERRGRHRRSARRAGVGVGSAGGDSRAARTSRDDV